VTGRRLSSRARWVAVATVAVAATVVAGALVTGLGLALPEGGGVKAPGPTTRAAAFAGTVLEPPIPRPDLTLLDTAGRPFDLSDRPADEVTVLFFGYTHCGDLCPTTMADLAAAGRLLPQPIRDAVQVVFVSEDPARDTPDVLREWLDGYDPDFVGLRGGNEATKRALRELYQTETRRIERPTPAIRHQHRADPDGHGDYGLEHGGTVYAFGPGGRSVIYTGGTTPRQYAEDFTKLTRP
jgi:protein SCO1